MYHPSDGLLLRLTKDNTWHRHCTTTLEDCEYVLTYKRRDGPDEPRELGTCRQTRNINPLDAANRIEAIMP